MAKRNRYERISKDEVEERIKYERALATAFAGLSECRSFNDFEKLELTDDMAKAVAFAAMNYKDRTWENFLALDLTNEMAKATAFAALTIERTWENFNTLGLEKDDMAKATAFAALNEVKNWYENFKDLNLTNEMAKAVAFAALQAKDRTLNNFEKLGLTDDMAKATAFAGLNEGKEWNNFQNFILDQLTNDMAIATAFAGLSVDKTLENFNKLNLKEDMAKAVAFAGVGDLNETKRMKEFEELKLTDPEAKAVAFAGLDIECKTMSNFKKIFGQRNRARIGGGVALVMLCVSVVTLVLLHTFCMPVAGVIDAVLAAIGIKTTAAAIVSGVIGFASIISSGLLFWKSKEIPKANKKLKMQIQQRNQKTQSKTENPETEKPSVLNERIPEAQNNAKNNMVIVDGNKTPQRKRKKSKNQDNRETELH